MVYAILLVLLFGRHGHASTEEERLVKNLFKGYNKLIRPVKNASDYVVVSLDLFLLQLINVVSIARLATIKTPPNLINRSRLSTKKNKS